MIGWMAQTDPPKEASKVYKNEWLVTTPLLKQNETPSGVLKKSTVFTIT